MIVLDLSILNQKGTPMFNSDTFANRPAFGIVGRIFISTDTKEFYRDTGTSWELIGGPGSGTITGSGAATQVAFWNGASTITGSNNLFWDSTNNYLGISTNTPTTALDVHHSTPSGAIFNQTTATNNNTINFQTSGSGRWRIGNFYTAGADDFGIFDVVGTLQQFTIVKTTGQTFIGAKTTASGRLVVNSATADNHLQIVGANSPSIRIDNAGSGGTQRFVFGLATATNNFIQGATAGEFCISTQSAGNMLFGMWQTTNASEVMRITTANNLLIGTNVDSGQRLQISGSAIATNYFVKTNAETTKISNPVPSGGAGNNIFIGGGGDNVIFTTLDTGGYNSALGIGSLTSVTTGYRNVAVGNASLDGITTGYHNIGIGDNSGRFDPIGNLITSNINCIYIGKSSRASTNGNTNEIVIGNNITGNGSNSVTIGTSSTLKSIIEGSLLLGYTTASSSKLSVNGNASINSNTTTNHSKLCVAGGIKFNNNTDQSINNSASYGNVYAATTNITAGTGANTIYSSTGSEGSLYVVSGINLTTNARFVDLLCVMGVSTATPVVVSSNFNGFPDTRTYTNTGESISLALTGADNYRIFVTGIGCNEKT
jgi:hypothetical protein